MRILVTGGAGFIGSRIADRYARENHEVAVLDNFVSGSRENVPQGARLYHADVCDRTAVEQAFRDFRPQVVSHHAAQLDVRKSVADPAFDAGVNVLGSLNVLGASVRIGVERFIFASSGGAIYGDAGLLPTPETAAHQPRSPYGLTKATFERYLRLWQSLHGITPVILRYANVYGPRQSPDGESGVIAIFSRRLLCGQRCSVYGDGTSTRDYVFVDDVVQANVQALHRGGGGVFNIGTGRETSLAALFGTVQEQVSQITNRFDPQVPERLPSNPGEVLRSCLDPQRAREQLHWSAATPLKDGLAATVHWMAERTGRRQVPAAA